MTQTLVYPTVEARWGQARAQLLNRSELYVLFFQIIADIWSSRPLDIAKRLPFRDYIIISQQWINKK